MALEQFFGRIVDMARRTDGDELTAAASIADIVLHVGDTADFDETGGAVEVNDERYTYSELDHDANTLTLDSGLLAAAAVGDRVDVVDEELDQVVVEYVANVQLEDQDPGDSPIEVTVNHGLVNYLSESVRGGYTESVTLLRDGDDDLVIWQVDGKLVVDLALELVRTDFDDSMSQVEADLTELNDVTLLALQVDLATLEGLFPITGTSISDGAISTPKLAANSVSTEKLIAGAVSADKLAANSVSADKIVANAITGDKIAANAIDGKTITGAHIKTAGSGARLELSSLSVATLEFIASSGATVGYLLLPTGGTGPRLQGGTNLFDVSAAGISAILNSGVFSVSGRLNATGQLHGDTLWSDADAGGSNSGADIGADGKVKRTTSSARYKYDVESASVDTAAVLSLSPKTFRRIDDASATEYLGLIAEEVEAAGLDHLVFYNSEEQVEGVHYASALVTALLAVCKDQQDQIDDLTARLGVIEATTP